LRNDLPKTLAISISLLSTCSNPVKIFWYKIGNIVSKAMKIGNSVGENHKIAIKTNEITGIERVIITIGLKKAFQKGEKADMAAKIKANEKARAKPNIPLRIVLEIIIRKLLFVKRRNTCLNKLITEGKMAGNPTNKEINCHKTARNSTARILGISLFTFIFNNFGK
jgi:hypothetical protein